MAPSYLRATEPLSCISLTKNAPKYLIKPEALCSESLHKSLISRDQGVGWVGGMELIAGNIAGLAPTAWEKKKQRLVQPGGTYGCNQGQNWSLGAGCR